MTSYDMIGTGDRDRGQGQRQGGSVSGVSFGTWGRVRGS